MAPSHCFLRARVKGRDRADAVDAFDLDFRFLRVDQTLIEETQPGVWQIDIPFSYPESENVAEGDLGEDIGAEFRALMDAKNIYDVEYEFHLVVGGLHADPFCIRPHMVTMIAVLGGSVFAHRSGSVAAGEQEAEQAAT